MDLIPYLLVVISATTHATWNLMAKRAGGSQIFLGLSKAAEAVLLLPVFIVIVVLRGTPVVPYWWLFAVGAVFTTLNYFFLGKAYSTGGSLSTVYPVARSSALMLLPLLAYAFIGERIDWIGGAAIVSIIAGIVVIQLDSFRRGDLAGWADSLRHPSMVFALLAGMAVASYSLWDKYALRSLPPFIYFYGYTALAALAYLVMIRSQTSWAAMRAELSARGRTIVAVGMLNTFTYLLVLFALQTSKASYVVALRQLSIGFGALMGWTLLHEPSPLPKRIGLALLLAGCVLVSFAR